MAQAIEREFAAFDPRYTWFVRMLAFGSPGKFLLLVPFIAISALLLMCIAFYFFARYVGFDVDPSLLYKGKTDFYHDLAHAIRSTSVDEKLNVLLRGHLNGFSNVTDILNRTLGWIRALSISAILFGVLALALRAYVQLYPRAFFALGLAKEQLARLQHKRELWFYGIVVALAVNLIAGLILAFLLS